jgi:hypothetical protein
MRENTLDMYIIQEKISRQKEVFHTITIKGVLTHDAEEDLEEVEVEEFFAEEIEAQ